MTANSLPALLRTIWSLMSRQCLPFLCWPLIFSGALSAVAAEKAPAKSGRAHAGDQLFTNRSIIRIKIDITGEDLATLEKDNRKYVRATVSDGETTFKEVAVHLKGSKLGSFRALDDRPSLTLNFDKFVDGQSFHGVDKLYLNNSVEDPTYMAEHLCNGLFQDAGVPAPRIAFARVTLNGRARGLYVLKEGFDKKFLRRWFDDPDGNFYDGGSREDITADKEKTSGDKSKGQADLNALAEAAHESDPAKRWERLGKVLDRDRFISFIAAEVMLWHWDGYAMNKNNYRVYHDLKSDRILFLPHGMDRMFEESEGPVLPKMEGLVAHAVVTTPEGRRQYLDRISALLKGSFTAAELNRRLDDLQARLKPAIVALDKRAESSYGRAVAEFRQHAIDRANYLAAQAKAGWTNAAPLSAK